MSRNAITDVAGLRVGHAHDATIASGVTALLFDEPCVASVAIGGGAPGLRDTALLEPGMTVERVDALVLSGGSAFGLDAMGGVQAVLREQGRGFRVGDATVPIVPGAILFDLLNGGDKAWGPAPVYWHLGFAAAAAVDLDVPQGSVGAGLGATTASLKGGLGSTSATTSGGFTVGALVAVNAVGAATIGDGPHFWAAPYEVGAEFGGLGWPSVRPADAMACRIKGLAPQNTTIAIVATDAALSRVEAKRLALMAQDGSGQGPAPRPCRDGRRYGVRRRDGPRPGRADALRSCRDRHARRRLFGAGRRPRYLCGGGLALRRGRAELARPFRPMILHKGRRPH